MAAPGPIRRSAGAPAILARVKMANTELGYPAGTEEAMTKIRAAHGAYTTLIVDELDKTGYDYDYGRVIHALDKLAAAQFSLEQAIAIPATIKELSAPAKEDK
jgi:cellobiose-specific phosphotransferase system component IIA